jgi:hypothetical protein
MVDRRLAARLDLAKRLNVKPVRVSGGQFDVGILHTLSMEESASSACQLNMQVRGGRLGSRSESKGSRVSSIDFITIGTDVFEHVCSSFSGNQL